MLIAQMTLVVLSALAGMGGSQTPSSANPGFIQVRAIVTDRDGHFVETLSADDFILLEDHVQQSLRSLSKDRVEGDKKDQPSLAEAQRLSSTSSKPDAPSAASRAIFLLVDTAHISLDGLEGVRKALRRFVNEQLADRDLVAIITASRKPVGTGGLTRDRAKLEEAIRKLHSEQGSFESFLTPALCGKVVRRDAEALQLAEQILDSEERTTGSLLAGGTSESEVASKCMMMLQEASTGRRAVMSAIRVATETLAAVPGQRIIAMFSEGFSMTAAGGDYAVAEVQPAISGAVRAGVVIYTFDPKVTLAGKQIDIGNLRLSSEIHDSARDAQQGAAILVTQTGGETSSSGNDLNTPLQKMIDENRCSYRLAYAPPQDKDPRKYRTIQVSVKNHPEYRVRSPKGYVLSDLAGKTK